MSAILRQAKERHQASIERHYPGDVLIDGVVYTGACMPGAETNVQTDDGWRRVQELRCAIRKSLLPHPPQIHTPLKHADKEWRLREVDGFAATDIAWQLLAYRFLPSS